MGCERCKNFGSIYCMAMDENDLPELDLSQYCPYYEEDKE